MKPTRAQIAAAYGKRIPDVLRPGLRVLFVGINPGLYSGAVKHHFARPGNRFWPTLRAAGLTPRLLSPFEERELLQWGFGITNIVGRATATADELNAAEIVAGARRLEKKIRRYRPQRVVFLGITSYRIAFAEPGAKLGRQERRLGDAEVWVLPNPSGLNAHYQLPALAKAFRAID